MAKLEQSQQLLNYLQAVHYRMRIFGTLRFYYQSNLC